MNKLWLALSLVCLGLAPAQAQNIPTPAIVGNAGAYNTSPPTCTAGQWCAFQTDVNGNLKTAPASGTTTSSNIAQITGATSNLISTVNSTATPLAANGVFTGTADEITPYASVSVTIFTDQASATNGLAIQQSSDGTNWDNSDTYTIPASTGKTFGVQIAARFMRVVYTNGATIQTTFRMQTILHGFMPVTQVQRASDAITNDNDFAETMAFGMIWNPASALWQRMPGTTTGININPYPATATPITASVTGTTAATVASLAANATKTNYICGFSITSDATLALSGTATVAGVISGTMSYVQGIATIPAVATTGQSFSPCIPSSAINTAITVTSAAAGAGGVTAVNVWGYQL